MTADNERFVFIESLGGGAFGQVFKAQDREIDNMLVAVKKPNSPDKEAALRREVKLMIRIKHLYEPHIVLIQDLHIIDGTKCIVMELVEGGSLRKAMGEIGSQTEIHPVDALNVAVQMCSALDTLHNAFMGEGIFHRDIKPENILNKNGIYKLADFGISKVLERSGIVETSAGTPPYMSPALLKGKADFRSDLYSLGVTLYEMLTAHLPFDPYSKEGRQKGLASYIGEICKGNPPSPERYGVDSELSAIVMKALHHKAERGYQSAKEMQEALKDITSRLNPEEAITAAWREGNPAKCEQELKKVVKRFPRNPRTYRNLSWFYNGQARFPESLKVLEGGYAKCKECGEFLVDLASAYNQVGKYQNALPILEEALKCQMPIVRQRNVRRLLASTRKRVK